MRGTSVPSVAELLLDLRSGRHLDGYIAVVLSIAAGVVAMFNVPLAVPVAVGLGTLSWVVLCLIHILKSDGVEARFNGLYSFSPGKSGHVHALQEFGEKATVELAISSVQFSSVISGYLDMLKCKATEGCRIRMLMMAELTASGEPNPSVEAHEAVKPYKGLRGKLRSSREALLMWRGGLPKEARERVEIRESVDNPSVAFLIVDSDSTAGLARVEVVLPRVQGGDLPNFIVRRGDNAPFFRTVCRSFQLTWDAARPLE